MTHHPHKGDPTVLQTFDPATFYPALAAREKLKHTRDDSCTTFPTAKSIAEPQIPKDFDPAVFYPALAAREKAKVVNSSSGEDHSIFTESINPGDSISYSHLPRVEQQVVVEDPDCERFEHKKRVRKRLWITGIVFLIATVILSLLFAWLGAHNFFKDQKVTIP
ncbi:MAG: hypothetical protein OHK93_001431 [Ramalina farinacea]|uniref:Uncharacterized protein n=1 Tax=Ramalina farinacea TaxID=258253 RepID=A0AA43TSV2_9LECA|nr:hypothetical protein [Ramalina farinacea]